MAQLLKIEGYATKEIALQQKPINDILKESEGVLISFVKASVKTNLTKLVKKHSKEIDELIAKDQLTTKEETRLKELRAIYKEPRIALNKITTHNSSVLAQASKTSKTVKDELVLIVEPVETKITKRLDDEDTRRENARIEKENKEKERKEKLQEIVDTVEADLQSIIDSTKEFSEIEENLKQFNSVVDIFNESVQIGDTILQEYDLVYEAMILEKSEAFDNLIKSLTTANDLEISNKALEVSRLTNERMSELFDYDYKYKGEKALGELSIEDYEIELKCAKFYFRKKHIELIGLVGNDILKSWIYATDTDLILVSITFDELNKLTDSEFEEKVNHFKSEIEDWNNPKEEVISGLQEAIQGNAAYQSNDNYDGTSKEVEVNLKEIGSDVKFKIKDTEVKFEVKSIEKEEYIDIQEKDFVITKDAEAIIENNENKAFNTEDFAIRENVISTVKDLVMGFLYYDRKEDEDLSIEGIQKAFKENIITIDEVVEIFKTELNDILNG